MRKPRTFERVTNIATAETITQDEHAYLRTLSENEKVTIAALQATRQSFERHLAQKYTLQNGDQINAEGGIVRAKKPEKEPIEK